MILKDAHDPFPTSLYMARKRLGVCAHIIKYATCEKCCKLYNVTEVTTNKPDHVPNISDCTYVDFLNHPMINQRGKCDAKLAKQISVKDGVIYKPIKIFPTIS